MTFHFHVNLESGIFNEVITDNLRTFFIVTIKLQKKNWTKFRDNSDCCITRMIERLSNFMLFFLPLLTAYKNFNIFVDEFDRIYKLSCPIKSKVISSDNVLKSWINYGIKLN